MTKVQTIISKAKTDAVFYKLVSTDFEKAIAPYKLTPVEISDLKTQLADVKPPLGSDVVSRKR